MQGDVKWDHVGLRLPVAIADLLTAAGAQDPEGGGLPQAMRVLVGALPWIAVALHRTLRPDDYARFAQQMKHNLDVTWQIVSADDPDAEFTRVYGEALELVQLPLPDDTTKH